ncbi:hypothetical protein [Coprococcus catus]|uniref:hypothetical protein n=1 Tax=Coprococcus catus TaxID=116085 RepID=UPI001C8BA429|nr:hypothetical protein [Coprococcus catus]MBX9230695.1 hypothetical protein [Coprococcus catus]MCT6801284.1 hypothetical protein [Coprococcus catus]
MDEKKDSLVVKPYKDDVVSSIAIGILCILMGIIFPDDGMYMFWFSIALVIFRACSVANEILILSKDGVIVKRGKRIKNYDWNDFNTKRVNHYNGYRNYKKAVILSRFKYIQGQGISPGIYQFINPYLLLAIPVGKKSIKPEADGSFVGRVDEAVLAEKLREWNVETSGDELKTPPWRENF